MRHHEYFVYIVTNNTKTTLYIGVTNSLEQRLTEHYLNKGTKRSFAGKYNCFYLLYFESFQFVFDAIDREKKIKGWTRKKKEELINSENSEWKFLNDSIMKWPPTEVVSR